MLNTWRDGLQWYLEYFKDYITDGLGTCQAYSFIEMYVNKSHTYSKRQKELILSGIRKQYGINKQGITASK